MTTQHQIDVAPTTDEDRAIATITMAFSNDPVARWVLPRCQPVPDVLATVRQGVRRGRVREGHR